LRQKRGTTILEVARLAGVSVGTVSNVLNHPDRVRHGRREQVLEAARRLGYIPNGLAQGLRRQRSGVVALCVPHTRSGYFAALVEAFDAVAARLGYEAMQVLTQADPIIERRRIEALLARRVDGLILVPSLRPAETLELLAASGLPVVIADRLEPDPRFDYVIVDNYGAMQKLTRHVLERGHRKLLFVAQSLDVVTTRHRRAALRDSLSSDASAEVVEMPPESNDYVALLRQSLGTQPPSTCLIAGNSTVLVATLKALRSIGTKCPEDISLAAFDDPPWIDLLDPPITTIRPPTDALARRAWELLLTRLARDPSPRARVVLEAELISRQSIKCMAETVGEASD
jgi:LacI family transcriptional regulator